MNRFFAPCVPYQEFLAYDGRLRGSSSRCQFGLCGLEWCDLEVKRTLRSYGEFLSGSISYFGKGTPCPSLLPLWKPDARNCRTPSPTADLKVFAPVLSWVFR